MESVDNGCIVFDNAVQEEDEGEDDFCPEQVDFDLTSTAPSWLQSSFHSHGPEPKQASPFQPCGADMQWLFGQGRRPPEVDERTASPP